MTRMQAQIEKIRQKSGDEGVKLALGNYSRTPKGEKRKFMPRFEIWPETKFAGRHNLVK